MSDITNYINIILQDLNQDMDINIKVNQIKGYTCINTEVKDLFNILKRLKENHGFNYLANLTAVDYPDHFEIIYHIHTIPDNRKIMIKTCVSREDAELPSAVSLWPAADWQEREVFDMLGIKFKDHPNLIRILLPDDFEGYPLRKDYQVKGD
ncbi:MAG: NADH-quinone oxidoreductase subunit C [Syntrophomonadaceae bacterium]